ncbi:hypothetical protein N0M98_26785 [Paenibacillus doosanensis]|uniref:hypothetical protein n=1 Tax=Paenibacillus doosanensis TaxID=1229154 RepID=UPI00217F792C|nr:hypothetical protein [Paenibacillus doosanensis]MCS7463716.1 hypothetical protein [Paenibacillus doosanensis]
MKFRTNRHARRFIRFMFAVLLCASPLLVPAGPPAEAIALPALAHKFSPPELPPVITLLEDTPLYPEPDDSDEPWAVLSPQDVQTVEAEQEWYLAPPPGEQGKRWIRISTTWLGDMWMHIDYDRIGRIVPADTNIALIWSAALYTEPVQSAQTDVVLAPQTVHCNAMFQTPGGSNAYRIETSWLGDMWLVRPNRILLDMEIIGRDMVLPTETLRMEDSDTAHRLQRPSEAVMIPPQTVYALEKTVNGEYHVRDAEGAEFWIDLRYAQPASAKPSSDTIQLSKDTLIHLFPAMDHPIFGSLSPQKIEAFQQWDDEQGQRWYRIHSWNGDLWILPDH